jgi:hypothetical protein
VNNDGFWPYQGFLLKRDLDPASNDTAPLCYDRPARSPLARAARRREYWPVSLAKRLARAVYRPIGQLYFRTMLLPYAKSAMSAMSLEEARFLAELTREANGDRPIVEIGALFGASTRVILLNKSPLQPVITVDLFNWNPAHLSPDQHYRLLSLGLRSFAGDDSGLEIVRADKNEFYSSYRGAPPALVFLDAMHTYEETLRDIRWAQTAGAMIICGHDYAPSWPGVIQAVDEAGGAKQICGTLWRLN